jgi:phosphatidylserine/phosphatidylglycerophosphate/cardiolipin synthase-like enzyme
MHGRIIIMDNKALVGSMNLNSASLTGPHIEFAIYIVQIEIISGLRRISHSKFKRLRQVEFPQVEARAK